MLKVYIVPFCSLEYNIPESDTEYTQDAICKKTISLILV